MATKPEGDFWKDAINKLTGPFPEAGTEPPDYEFIKEVKTYDGMDPSSVGNFSRISLDIYFFFDQVNHKYFMMQNQKMFDLGEMTLEEAAEIVKKRQKRK
jgi:hypothetical protein